MVTGSPPGSDVDRALDRVGAAERGAELDAPARRRLSVAYSTTLPFAGTVRAPAGRRRPVASLTSIVSALATGSRSC